MTTGDEAKARELLATAKALFLDFDGPICSVFAGLSAPTVAEQLRVVLADGGHTDLPESVATADDPFDVFRYSATLGDDEARYVEAAFTALEVEAIATAEPTPGAHDLIHAWHRSGRPLAIVSNNSAASIEVYLDLYRLRTEVDVISARVHPDADLLKPNPFLLAGAMQTLLTPAKQGLFVGDSESDIYAAIKVDMKIIGYANKPGKGEALKARGCAALIPTIYSLLTRQSVD